MAPAPLDRPVLNLLTIMLEEEKIYVLLWKFSGVLGIIPSMECAEEFVPGATGKTSITCFPRRQEDYRHVLPKTPGRLQSRASQDAKNTSVTCFPRRYMVKNGDRFCRRGGEVLTCPETGLLVLFAITSYSYTNTELSAEDNGCRESSQCLLGVRDDTESGCSLRNAVIRS